MKKKLVIGSIIALTSIALITVAILKTSGGTFGFGGKGYEVQTITVEKGDISSYITANGITEEANKAEVYFEGSYKVLDIVAPEGSVVKKGDQILRLDMDSLNSELEKLRINRSIQELSMKSAASATEIQRLQSAVDSAKRSFNDAEENYTQGKETYLAGVITQKQLDALESAFKSAESALRDSQRGLQSAINSKAINDETSAANLKLTDLTIRDLQKRIDAAQAGTKSSIDGIVALINVKEGGYTNSSQPAYKVIDEGSVLVEADVKEYDSKSVFVGQITRITGDAIDKNVEIEGEITFVSPIAETKVTGSGNETIIKIKVLVDKSSEKIRPGLTVSCDIYTVEKKDVLVIPMETIGEDKDGNKYVFVADAKSATMKQRSIETGIYSDMNVEVISGLDEGEMLIKAPQPFYSDGEKIVIVGE